MVENVKKILCVSHEYGNTVGHILQWVVLNN